MLNTMVVDTDIVINYCKRPLLNTKYTRTGTCVGLEAEITRLVSPTLLQKTSGYTRPTKANASPSRIGYQSSILS